MRVWLCLTIAVSFQGNAGATNACCNYCLGLSSTNTLEFCGYTYRGSFCCSGGSCEKYSVRNKVTCSEPVLQRVDGCSNCPAGFYRDQRRTQCLCDACTNPVGAGCVNVNGWYVSKECGPENDMECSQCNSCPIGEQWTGQCFNKEGTHCEACPSGKYRSSLSMASCSSCITCDTNQRQRRTACGPINDRTCVQCDQGSIVTGADLDTCTPCGANQYAWANDNTCKTCSNCARSHYQQTACSNSADRVCQACPNNRITSTTNSASCSACKTGYYNAGGSTSEPICNECATSSCGTIGTYVSCTTTDQMGSRTCEWCEGQAHEDSVKCAAGSGVSRACDGTGTTKTSCALCEAGTERPAGTAMVDMGSSRFIQKCIACGTGKFKAGTSSANCGNCTNKPANSQYTSWSAGTTPSSNTCPW